MNRATPIAGIQLRSGSTLLGLVVGAARLYLPNRLFAGIKPESGSTLLVLVKGHPLITSMETSI